MNIVALITKFETYLLTEQRVSHNTFQAYRRDLKQLVDFCTERMIEDTQALTPATLSDFCAQLRERGVGPRSIVRKISVLKACFAFAAERLNIPNHAYGLLFPKVEKKLPRYLSSQEIEQLFTLVEEDNSPLGVRNRVIMYLLYASGMRVSELTMLTLSNIHLDTGKLIVRGKGGKERIIPLPLPMMQLLEQYIGTLAAGVSFLLPVQYGGVYKPISRQAIWIIVRDLCKKAGINRPVSPHQLRHSVATHLLQKGMNLRSLQMLLGHENIATVQVYTHVETSYVRSVYDKKHVRS